MTIICIRMNFSGKEKKKEEKQQVSGQGVIAVNVGGQSEGTQIGLTDSSGNEILAYTPELSFSVFIYSSPDIVKGESYTVLIGSDSGTVTANQKKISTHLK